MAFPLHSHIYVYRMCVRIERTHIFFGATPRIRASNLIHILCSLCNRCNECHAMMIIIIIITETTKSRDTKRLRPVDSASDDTANGHGSSSDFFMFMENLFKRLGRCGNVWARLTNRALHSNCTRAREPRLTSKTTMATNTHTYMVEHREQPLLRCLMRCKRATERKWIYSIYVFDIILYFRNYAIAVFRQTINVGLSLLLWHQPIAI